MSVPTLQPGDTIEASWWPEPLKIDKIEAVGRSRVRIIGSLIRTQRHIDQIFTLEELNRLHSCKVEEGFDAPPRQVFLALEAKRYRFASLYDPLLAVNISKVDPLPHQIEAVYGYILRQPRVRFLIADDPGAGKTIMAGLVVKEMKLRGLIKRILIVTPGHLKDQWRRELADRFKESFVLIDRQAMRNRFGENVWETEYQIITSLDFARQEDVMQALAVVHWDLVIVDEAHKMAAYRYGRKVSKTKRYRLGELLSRSSTHLLLLTATPHRGDPEGFRLFLDLLQPGAFATVEMLEKSISKGDNPLFIRRLKEDLRDFEGKPLFLPRHVRTLAFNLGKESPDEKKLYNDLSRYVHEQYNKALSVGDKRRNITFALVILQRRMASSTYALYRSLRRRKKRLEELREQSEAFRVKRGLFREDLFSPDEIEDLSEEERWELESIWEALSVAETRAELDEEIRTLDALLEQAKAVIEQGEEVKLRQFKKALDELQTHEPNEKILVFTESRDTLEYLERRLLDWGYTVCTIHGGMPLEDRIEAEGVFKNRAQIMVATEAAGEGINLQFCHLMINYDIPWNPNRLEQRMGRIHRYGQTREVTIFNLVATDTREGRVLNRLFEKLREIAAALGSDKVFDVIDELFPGRNLAQLLVDAAASARTLEDILREIDIRVDEDYLRNVRDKLGESLATRYIDYTRIREMNARAREHRLIPEYTQAFFQKAWEHLGGFMRPRKDMGRDGYFTVKKIPYPIRAIAESEEFKRRFGTLQRDFPLITFDKSLAMRESRADFVSFGHPLFEAVLRWAEHELSDALRRGATFIDPDGARDGVLLFFEGEIVDGLGEIAGKRLFGLFVPRDGGDVLAVDPAIIWDLAPSDGPADDHEFDLDALKSQAMEWVIPHLEAYMQEIAAERHRQAEIKKRYGLDSLRHLILELDKDLIRLQERAESGEDVALVIRNKRQQKEDYLNAIDKLRETMEREISLSLNTPRFLSAIRVMPMSATKDASDVMRSCAEIERIGMEIAMSYERRHGRQPQDVSAENLGYDLRSEERLPDGSLRYRYIEVKARADAGPVVMTKNEWFKAQRLGDDYYLYVVLNAAAEPKLHIIQNPSAKVEPEQLLEVRYRLPLQAILEYTI